MEQGTANSMDSNILNMETWSKVAMIAGAAAAVVLTILMVVCFIGDGCLVYEVLERRKSKNDKARKLSGTLYGSQGKEVSLMEYKNGNAERVQRQTNGTCTTYSAVSERADSLAGRLRTDSTYSSMSSSTDTSSIRSSAPSISSSSLPESTSPSQQEKPALPAISFSLLVTVIPDSPSVKLAIAVESATDLPARDYGAHCDPWISVTILRDRKSLRRRPPTPLAFFRTKTIRHAHNPFYSQTFIADILKEELKDISVRLCAIDQDRHCGPVEMGSTNITLKDAKQTLADPDKYSSTQFLNPPKKEFGDIQFGMSYLPTAQRLSFSIVKVNNLKYEKEDKNEDDTTNPYVRILMFNASGRLVKKKKTTVKINTKDPVYNETLNFEVPPGHLEASRFLVMVCTRRKELELDLGHENSTDQMSPGNDEEDYTAYSNSNERRTEQRVKDACLGKVAIGRSVRGDKEKEHYRSVMATPRKVFTVSHTLR